MVLKQKRMSGTETNTHGTESSTHGTETKRKSASENAKVTITFSMRICRQTAVTTLLCILSVH
jgi:hypothetical protein